MGFHIIVSNTLCQISFCYDRFRSDKSCPARVTQHKCTAVSQIIIINVDSMGPRDTHFFHYFVYFRERSVQICCNVLDKISLNHFVNQFLHLCQLRAKMPARFTILCQRTSQFRANYHIQNGSLIQEYKKPTPMIYFKVKQQIGYQHHDHKTIKGKLLELVRFLT